MLPKNNYSSETIIKKFNLNKNQVIFFNNDNPDNIYKIFSKSLELITRVECQRSNSASEFLINNIYKKKI